MAKETRNILDENGVVVGQLTLDNTTTEAQWAAMLEAYRKFLSSVSIE